MTSQSVFLAQQLNALKDDVSKKMSPETLSVIEETTKDLDERYTPKPLAIGTTAAQFSFSNAKGTTVTLSTLLLSHKAVVLTWYRGGWCPYCNLTLRTLVQANDELKSLGARLVALTPETPDESLSTSQKNDLTFEVLSDDGSNVADSFGIAYEGGNGLKDLYKGLGMDFGNMNGNDGNRIEKLPVSATFVLDSNGKVVYHITELDWTKRAEPADVISAVKKLVQV